MQGSCRAFWTGSVVAVALACVALGAEARTLRVNILADPAMVDPITLVSAGSGAVQILPKCYPRPFSVLTLDGF